MYFKFVTVCSAGCSLVFPAVEDIVTYWDCGFQCDPGNSIHHNSSTSFLSLKVKADTVQAAVAEPEEAADCEQCLQKETQRQEESESRLQMLGLSGVEVL